MTGARTGTARAGLGFAYGLVARDTVKLWPFAAISAGLTGLAGVLLQMARRK